MSQRSSSLNRWPNTGSNEADQGMTPTHSSDTVTLRQERLRPAKVHLVGNGAVAPNFLLRMEIIEVSTHRRKIKRMAEAKLSRMQEETNSTSGNNQYFRVAAQKKQRRARQASAYKRNYGKHTICTKPFEHAQEALHAQRDQYRRTNITRCLCSVNLIGTSPSNSVPRTCFVKSSTEHVSKHIHD